jgi:hypothetical protein
LGFIGKIQKTSKKMSRKLGNGSASKNNATVVATAAPQPNQEYIVHPKRIPEEEEDEESEEDHHKKIHEHLEALKETMAED